MEILLTYIAVLAIVMTVVSHYEFLRKIVFSTIAKGINRCFLRLDSYVNNKERVQKSGVFNTEGHSPILSVLVIGVLVYTIYGPTLSPLSALAEPHRWADREIWWNIGAFAFFIVLVLSLALMVKHFKGRALQFLHASLIFVAALPVVLLLDPRVVDYLRIDHTEASGLPYRHVFAYLSLGFVFVAFFFSRITAYFTVGQLILDGEKAEIARTLLPLWHFKSKDPQQPLWYFENKDPKLPVLSRGRAFNAWMMVPFRYPIVLLLFPSVMVLLSATLLDPDRDRDQYVFLTAGLIIFGILSVGNCHNDLKMVGVLARRRFAIGGSLVISSAIIALAVSYLLNISYVTTVMRGMGWIIWNYIVAAYVLVWLYDYWSNRVATTTLLALFEPPDDGDNPNQTRISKLLWGAKDLAGFRDDWRTPEYTRDDGVQATLRLHGRSRFIASEVQNPSNNSGALLANELFEALADAASVSKESSGLENLPERAKQLQIDVSRLMTNHLVSLHTALIIVAIAVFMYVNPAKPYPMLTVMGPAPQSSVSNDCGVIQLQLHCLLSKHIDKHGEKPVLLLAASGGGTRAALYTTSMLYGLHQRGLDQQIVLLSGVSGGGAALAYYAANRDDLMGDDPDYVCATKTNVSSPEIMDMQPKSWSCFFRAMSTAFIRDVFEGVAEIRIVGGLPNGKLLEESFVRNFGQDVTNLLDIKQIGLILNTTVAGHSRDVSEMLTDLMCDPKPCATTKADFTVHAGTRLVFTNLVGGAFTRQETNEPRDVFLKYKVLNYGEITIPVAAALSANFPPVFSNAGVTVIEDQNQKNAQRYWVTDGGVADNRGIVSLLLTLRQTLQYMKKKRKQVPEIHIVVAEASYSNDDYATGGRGISVLMGSSAPFASQLMHELLGDIRQLAGDLARQRANQRKKIYFHYIEMPRVFRTRGGQGTHWMLPEKIVLTNPRIEDLDDVDKDRDTIELNKDQILGIAATYHGEGSCKDNMPQKIKDHFLLDNEDLWVDEKTNEPIDKNFKLNWICGDLHEKSWRRFLASLRNG